MRTRSSGPGPRSCARPAARAERRVGVPASRRPRPRSHRRRSRSRGRWRARPSPPTRPASSRRRAACSRRRGRIYPSAQIVRLAGYSELALEHWEKSVELLEESLAAKVAPLDEAVRKDVQEQLAKALAHFGSDHPELARPGDGVLGRRRAAGSAMPDKPIRLLEGKHKITVRAKDHIDVSERGQGRGWQVDRPRARSQGQAQGSAASAAPAAQGGAASAQGPLPQPEGSSAYGLVGGGVALGVGALTTALVGMQLREPDRRGHQRSTTASTAIAARGVTTASAPSTSSVINHQLDQADALGNASIGLLVGAVVLGGGGAALILTAPKPAAKPRPSDEHGSPPSAEAPPSAAASRAASGSPAPVSSDRDAPAASAPSRPRLARDPGWVLLAGSSGSGCIEVAGPAREGRDRRQGGQGLRGRGPRAGVHPDRASRSASTRATTTATGSSTRAAGCTRASSSS
jgi:hypothetical protein